MGNLTSGPLECLCQLLSTSFPLWQSFQKFAVGTRIMRLKQLRDPGVCSLDLRDTGPCSCFSVSCLPIEIDSLLSGIKGLICRLGSKAWSRDILKARFDLLEKQREGNLDTSKSTIKRLWNRIAQDVTGDVTRWDARIRWMVSLSWENAWFWEQGRGQFRGGRWECWWMLRGNRNVESKGWLMPD